MGKNCMSIGKYKPNGLSPMLLLGRDINKNVLENSIHTLNIS